MAFNATLETTDNVAVIALTGELDASSAPEFKKLIDEAAESNPQKLILLMDQLSFMASAGLRVLIFAKQKMGSGVDMYVVGTQEPVRETLTMTGFHYSVTMLDTYNPDEFVGA